MAAHGEGPIDSEGKEEGASFEVALQSLTEIVEQLEQGDLTLDEALKLFETGAGLARQCHQHLDQAEAKIQLLLEEHGDVLLVAAEESGVQTDGKEAGAAAGGAHAADKP